MKRILMGMAVLGLISTAPARAADEKTETKTEHKSDSHGGSNMMTEHSSKHGGAKAEEKTEVEHKARADGKMETTKKTKHSKKPAGRMTSDKTTTKEKTVTDKSGNVVEHEKTVK